MYVLTGPEAITYAEVAAALSAATGRDVEYVDFPAEAASGQLIQAGLPAFAAEQIVAIFALRARRAPRGRHGDGGVARPVLAPHDFASFARDCAQPVRDPST